MIQDVKLEKNSDGVYDLVLDGSDFATVSGLETAILLSLFTDARTDSGEVPEAFRREGWSGNLLDISRNYELGSELWLLDQARINNVTLNRAENFAFKSLSWLIDRGIAENIEIEIRQETTRGIYIEIKLFKRFNLIERYDTLWRSTISIE